MKLEFTQEALDAIVDKAIEFKLGARGLRSIVENVMMEAMYPRDTHEVTMRYHSVGIELT